MTEANWIAVAFAVVSTLGGVASAVTARKSNRDKLEFDAKAVTQDAKIAALQADLTEATTRAAADAARIAKVEADLASCKDQHAVSDVDRAELRGQLAAMKSLMAGTAVDHRLPG